MNKVDIVQNVFEKTPLTLESSGEAVQAIFDNLKDILANSPDGEGIIIKKFGRFRVRAKGIRKGRNPKTGSRATIWPRRVVIFKASSNFKAASYGEEYFILGQKTNYNAE